MDKRELIARRVARELRDGDVVNLGIGMPTMVADYIPEGVSVVLQSENGLLGLGPAADTAAATDPAATATTATAMATSDPLAAAPNITNAGGAPVTVIPGACFFDSAASFAIIRGGHVATTVLGALEVDAEGNLASWMIPGKRVPGMGGAMDLVVGARRVIVAMEHCNKTGEPKIVEHCRLPLTAARQVDLIVTEMGVIRVLSGGGLLLVETAPGVSADQVRAATGAPLTVSEELKTMQI